MSAYENLFLCVCLVLACVLCLAPHAMATGNIIENFPAQDPVCAVSEMILITYADADNDPNTGVSVNGTWYPNETQVVLYPIQGDLSVNSAGSSGQIQFSFVGSGCGETGWQTKKGKFVIRFVDATAPGWVWNIPDTWQEKPIAEARLKMSHDEHGNYRTYVGPNDAANVPNPYPYLQVKAYQHWGRNGVVSEFSQIGLSPCCVLEPGVLSGTTGFSELYFSTDFAESTIDDLCLFDTESLPTDRPVFVARTPYPVELARIGEAVIGDLRIFDQAVPGKALHVLTRSGIVEVALTGAQQMLLDGHEQSRDLEILNGELYVTDKSRGGNIVVYDLQGNYRKTIPVPSQASEYLKFVALPEEQFALLDNTNDRVFFIDDRGNLLGTASIQDPRGSLQHLDGVVAGNRLIVSHDGQQHVLQIDLTTYEVSLFKDLSSLSDRLGPIAHADGEYYICGPRAIYAFSESDSAVQVAEIPEGNITGITVIDDLAYLSVNFTGEIYEVDLRSGTASVLVSGLDYPVDLEYGADLESTAEMNCFELWMPVRELPVPDGDTACWTFVEPWFMSLPPKPGWAPEDALVAQMEYKLAVRGPHLRCRDYEIYLDNDPHDSDPGVLLYDNWGGLTDGGHDDDLEDDGDLELGWTSTHVFDGQSVHQDWTVCVSDTVSGYSGHMAELCLRICYEVGADEPDGCLPDLKPWVPLEWIFHPETLDLCHSRKQLEISYGLENVGCSDATDFYVCFYASTDTTITSSDHLLTRVSHTLAAGTHGYWAMEVTLDRGELAPGTYYIGAIIDCADDVQESDESNNIWVVPWLPGGYNELIISECDGT